AQPGDEVEILVLRGVGELHHLAHAGGIDADVLFTENVFSRADGGLEVDRAEVRCGGQQYHVHVLDDALVVVPPGELPVGGNVDLRSDIRLRHQHAQLG